MKTKRYDKRFLPMLWIGLVLWLGSMLVSAVMEWTGNKLPGQSTLMDMGKWMFHSVPVMTLLLLCLIQPIFEEFAFRLWGVGKKWTTIVCLVLMTLFATSEMGWWGLLFVAAILFVWLAVSDRFVQMWINAILSSVCFALCHVSGFGDFSLGMVLGMVDIFGMALVLCWLTINFSIWLSALLHVLNNSLAILIPLLFLGSPSKLDCYTQQGGGNPSFVYNLSMEPLRPFADNAALIDGADQLWNLDSTTTEFYLVGDPAQIAACLAGQVNKEPYTYLDWESKGESLEERVVFKVFNIASPGAPDYVKLLKDYLVLAEKYGGEPLVFDTTEVMLKEAWLVYPDGHEVLFEEGCDDYAKAADRIMSSSFGMRGNMLITEYEEVNDSTIVPHDYCLLNSNPLAEKLGMDSMEDMMSQLTGFKIEYRDARPATLIVIK